MIGPRRQRSLPISVIVPVLNEERNLADCLASLGWADEVFVVDSHSVDRTADIAREAGAKVVPFPYQLGGPRKKAWALAHLPLRNPWVFLIDADERVTPELASELFDLFDRGPNRDGYYVNRQLLFLGRWLRWGGNFPSWNLRLFRLGAGRFERLGTERLQQAGDVEVHEHVLLDGVAGYLRAPLRHHDCKDLHAFIDRHNRYSTWDARMRDELLAGRPVDGIPPRLWGTPPERKRLLKRIWVHLPCRPLLRFLYMYVLRLGFLDGKPGLLYAGLKAVQEFHIHCKQYEHRIGWASDDPTLPAAIPLRPPRHRRRQHPRRPAPRR